MSGGYEIALWILLVLASLTDLRWGKIFNVITIPFFLAGLVCRAFHGGMDGLGVGLVSFGVATLLFFPLYYLKTLAAGDVKLLMAIAPWVAPRTVVAIAAISILFGAFVGITLMLRQSGLKAGARSVVEHARNFVPTKSHRMPFAPAFLCAFLVLKIAESYRWSFF